MEVSYPMSDQATCRECGDPVEGLGTVFVVYGDYDADRQGFKRGDHNWHLCESCWRSEYDSPKATTYQTDDADELWEILAASDGQLVADLSAFFIPGPCYARVVDGTLETCTVNQNPHEKDGQIAFDPEAELMDEHDLFLEGLLKDNEREVPIYLRTADDTPFADLKDDVKQRNRRTLNERDQEGSA